MEYEDEDLTEPPKVFTNPVMPPKGPYTRVPITWGNREFYMDDPKDATELTQHLIHTIGTQQSDLKQMVEQIAAIPTEKREGTSTSDTSTNVTVQDIHTLIRSVRSSNDEVQDSQDPVLTQRNGRQINREVFRAPPGAVNIKTELPKEFDGTLVDAEPFETRMLSYFARRAKDMQTFKARALVTLSLLKGKRTKRWAEQVEKAIANDIDNAYYFGTWESFMKEFHTLYGIPDYENHYWRSLMKFQFPEKGNLRTAYDSFEALRLRANRSKEEAFPFLLQALPPNLRFQLSLQSNAPEDYDSWVEQLARVQNVKNREHEFRRSMAMPVFRAPQKETQYVPMDVDALEQMVAAIKAKKAGNAKKKAPTKKPLVKKSPGPGRSSGKPNFKPRQPRDKSKDKCHGCGKLGHWAGECPNPTVRDVYDHMIQAFQVAADDGDEQFELEEEEEDFEEEEETIEQESLINLDDDENDNDQSGQSF